jgi:hypothetical protein
VNDDEEDDHRDCFETSEKLGCGGLARRAPEVSGENLD